MTSKGLARIGFQDRDLARGEWSVFNAGSWFTREGASGPVKTGGITEHAIEILSPTHARVRHKKGDLLCPGPEIAARFYEKKGQPPAGFETVDQFYDRSGIIPLVPVNDFNRAPAIRALQATRTGRGAR